MSLTSHSLRAALPEALSDSSRGLDKTGTGLGMFIAKSKIEAHGEKIGVESEYQKYCRFYFTLSGNEKYVQKQISEK